MAKLTISETQAELYMVALDYAYVHHPDPGVRARAREALESLRGKLARLRQKLGPRDQRRPA